MGRRSGGVRALGKQTKAYVNRQKEVQELLKSGKYSSVTFDPQGGGYVAIEKSKMKHKAEEIEVAQILAKNGFRVILKDENQTIKLPNNKNKTVDGYLFNASFEQSTPTATNIKKCLEHARDKRADISVIYDKNKLYHREDVYSGIEKFNKISKYTFKSIIVIGSNKKVHYHRQK